MYKITKSVFVKSILNINERPEQVYPEFAFAGRSNVGKSSLINILLNRKNIARVSKQPGKTRTINYFLINEKIFFVDLPGYGFARVPKTEKLKWHNSIENYILENDRMLLLFVLIDALVGPQKNDEQLLKWLKYHTIPFNIILTKIDKISKNRQILQRTRMISNYDLNKENIILPFSAKTRDGREDILTKIEGILKNYGLN